MLTETDLDLGDGHALHVYDTGATSPGAADGELVVFWHHGTPNIGAPPAPLFPASHRLRVRWVSYDRPGYGGSTPNHGRDIASAARYVALAADALGIERFAVMGHSGGGPHALACGALLSDRVLAVVSGAGLAPFDADGIDWFAGMAASGEASLRAAVQGRAVKKAYEASAADLDMGFTEADIEALSGPWKWFGEVVGPALEAGPGGLIDDDLAYVADWGFDPALITAPLLLVHGGQDAIVPSSHSEWLAGHCRTAELRFFPEDSHISVLNHAEAALDWLAEQSRRA
ncbi:MAG TPA: alpha/beta hydrolase [Streptosporangiaceae bacterium]